MSFIFLIIAFSLNALANILLKLGAQRGVDFVNLNFLEIISRNFLVVIGLLLFALNAGFYFLALRLIPLSLAYPIMVVMSLLIINTFAYFYFHESINFLQVIGYVFIIVGIIFVSRFK